MAEIDELLANAEEIDYLADDIQFLIDENLRTVTIPSDGVVLGVEGDKNSNRVNFQMPRYYNGFDMSEFTVRVNYVNANGDPGVYTVKDLEVRDDMILFTWLVDSDACAYVGVVRFLVRMTITNNSELIQAFDTTIAKANVLEGLPITNIVDEEDRYDIVLHLMGEVDEYIEKRVGNIDALEMVGRSTEGVEYEEGQVGQNGAEIFNDYENNVAIGEYSHSEGYYTTASANHSHSEGSFATASGTISHAEGYKTTASGNASHAEGNQTTASEEAAHSEGTSTTASGNSSHAEGSETTASGNYSHSEGHQTTAFGVASHAEGEDCYAEANMSHAEGWGSSTTGAGSHAEGFQSVASGNYSHAEGYEAKAENAASHAEGMNTTASGPYSHAEGSATTASADSAHAEGYQTIASGQFSHAEGFKTKASSECQHVQGKFNIEDTNETYAFIIGNGNDYTPSNAFTVDWDGDVIAKGNFYSTNNSRENQLVTQATIDKLIEDLGDSYSGVGQNTDGKTFENVTVNGSTSTYYGNDTAEIFNDYANNIAVGSYSHAEGSNTKALDMRAHAEGYETLAKGMNSHAEGEYTIASGKSSHAEGSNTKASGENQHVQGKYNIEDAAGKYAFIIGNGDADNNRSNAFTVDWDGNVVAKGDLYSNDKKLITEDQIENFSTNSVGENTEDKTYTIRGLTYEGHKSDEIFNDYENNIACGEYAHAEGSNATASGKYSHAEGYKTTASGEYSHAEGSETYATTLYAHAEGSMSIARGFGAHAEGNQTTASGQASHAEGYDTEATGDNSHAEGSGTLASSYQSHAEGTMTIAASANQHAQGKYNVEDANNKYAFIIGNGAGAKARSNAFAVDWDGKVYVNNAEDGVDVSKLAGRKVAGTEYTIDDVVKTAEGGAEVFNNYSSNIATGAASHAEGEGTKALSWASHAEGKNTTASGQFSHSEGYKTTASGTYSHAEGGQTTASGDYSHAEGYKTTASGTNSHAEGTMTIAASANQHVMGKYNIDDARDVYAFIIGNGTSATERSNAFAIRWDGIIRVNNTDINLSKLAGKKVEGRTYTYYNTEYTAGKNAEVFNDYTDNKAIGKNSHAEGTVTTAIGNGSHAEGNFTRARGNYSHAEGQDTDALGFGSHSEGVGTYAKGDYSHAEGRSTIAAGECQHVIGKFNVADEDSKYALIIGNGEITDSVTWERSNAFAIDWNGKIYVNGSDTGVDVSVIPSLIARIEALEAANGS